MAHHGGGGELPGHLAVVDGRGRGEAPSHVWRRGGLDGLMGLMAHVVPGHGRVTPWPENEEARGAT